MRKRIELKIQNSDSQTLFVQTSLSGGITAREKDGRTIFLGRSFSFPDQSLQKEIILPSGSFHPPEQILPLPTELQQYISYNPIAASQILIITLSSMCSNWLINCLLLIASLSSLVQVCYCWIPHSLLGSHPSALNLKSIYRYSTRQGKKKKRITFGSPQSGGNTTAVTIVFVMI